MKRFLLLFLGFFPFGWVYAFNDISVVDPQYYVFEHLRDVGVMTPYQDGNFHPERLITRAEALTIALRAGGIWIPGEFNGEFYFSDIDPNSWYAPVVNRAVETEVILASSERFRPDDIVSKAEFLAMLFRATQVDFRPYLRETKDIADDISQDDWYALHFAYAKRYQIAHLPPDRMYRPQKPLSRREVAIMTYRQLRIFHGDEVTKTFVELQAVIERFINLLQEGQEDQATMQLQKIVDLTSKMTQMQNNQDAIAANAISLSMTYFSESLQSFQYGNYLRFLSRLNLAEKQAQRAKTYSESIAPFAEKIIQLIDETLTSFDQPRY